MFAASIGDKLVMVYGRFDVSDNYITETLPEKYMVKSSLESFVRVAFCRCSAMTRILRKWLTDATFFI